MVEAVLKACLNGGVSRDEHPAVPITPAELAADAARVRQAGAAAVHVHPRDPDGRETLDATHVGAAIDAIRRACPGLPVGVSTGAWIEPDPAARVRAVESWTVRPDFASVNAHEDGARDVARALHEHGIGVEAGIWTPAAFDRHRTWDTPVLRILVETMEHDPDEARANADAIMARIPPEQPTLVHAEGPAAWAILRHALERRKDLRIGLEDTRRLPDGAPAPDNAALVAAARAMMENQRREVGQEGR
jgi:uncharacterized protein (DUF849 family)